MKLTESDITQFQALYLRYFGEQIEREAARMQLSALVRQMELVYRPASYAELERQFKRDTDGD